MYTEELLNVIPLKKIIGQLPNRIKDISIDSRSVQPKSMFICIKGDTVDGHHFAQKAVDAGATVVVAERELPIEGEVAQVIVKIQIVPLVYLLLSFLIILLTILQ